MRTHESNIDSHLSLSWCTVIRCEATDQPNQQTVCTWMTTLRLFYHRILGGPRGDIIHLWLSLKSFQNNVLGLCRPLQNLNFITKEEIKTVLQHTV